MKRALFVLLLLSAIATGSSLLAQTSYKTARLQQAAKATGLSLASVPLMPDTTITASSRDGRRIAVRTNAMGEVEHIGIPLFNEAMRLLQPSPVYDFLEYAVLDKKYGINPNQLNLSKVIFKKGTWDTLLSTRFDTLDCNIVNREDKLYIITWSKGGKEKAVLGVPIDYELLNNDTRRHMERDLVAALAAFAPARLLRDSSEVSEDDLSIYGTGGLFVLPGKSYLIDLLNQNTYYELTTVLERADPLSPFEEAVLPVAVLNNEFPAETFANIMLCNKAGIPDDTVRLDFHLSDYHRKVVSLPISRLRAFLRQQGCQLYFACSGVADGKIKGLMFACNLPKGYNHLFSLSTAVDDLTSENCVIKGDVYLYIPPITKEKLFGIAPSKKSKAYYKLPR